MSKKYFEDGGIRTRDVSIRNLLEYVTTVAIKLVFLSDLRVNFRYFRIFFENVLEYQSRQNQFFISVHFHADG